MGLAEDEIAHVDWARFRVPGGEARDVGDALLALLSTGSPSESKAVWGARIENKVFSQDNIEDSAEPVVEIMLAALADDRPEWIRSDVLELLFLVLNAALKDPRFADGCRVRAREGLWLLVREARTGPTAGAREDAVEVLHLVAPERIPRSRHG